MASTRALGLAVDRCDQSMLELLLENGVQCDFKEGDRPNPQHPDDLSQYGGRLDEPKEFKPPLIRAVQKGNTDLVRLLLLHGADPNVACHELCCCCRAIELAVKAERLEIVQLLLDSGADISLPQSVWDVPGHECELLSRADYLRLMAKLQALAV